MATFLERLPADLSFYNGIEDKFCDLRTGRVLRADEPHTQFTAWFESEVMRMVALGIRYPEAMICASAVAALFDELNRVRENA